MSPDAFEQVKLGELRYALGFISTDAAASVSRALPPFYENLKKPMHVRREYLSAAIKVLAKELERIAEEIK